MTAKTAGAVAGAGAPNRDKTEPFNGTGDKFAIEAAANQDSDAIVAKTPGAGEEAAMPECVDCRRRRVVTGTRPWIADVAVAEGYTEAADGHARQARNNSEGDALLQAKSLGHEDEFTVGGDRGLAKDGRELNMKAQATG